MLPRAAATAVQATAAYLTLNVTFSSSFCALLSTTSSVVVLTDRNEDSSCTCMGQKGELVGVEAVWVSSVGLPASQQRARLSCKPGSKTLP